MVAADTGDMHIPTALSKFVRPFLAVAAVSLAAMLWLLPAASASLPSVAVCYSDNIAANVSDVHSKLTGTGDFSTVDMLNCGAGTPSVATLQGYSGVLVYTNDLFSDSAALGNNLADYVDGGGTVVIATFALYNDPYLGVQGRLLSGNYLPFTPGGQTQGTEETLVPDVPGSSLLNGVSSFDGGTSSYQNVVSLTSGATQVAHWTGGNPLVAYKGRVVGLNLFPPSTDARVDFWKANTNGAQLMANALLYLYTPPSNTVSAGPRGAYCTVAGNSSDSGVPLQPGTFVNLDDGQALSDPHYAGATPAEFVQGVGLTCGAPPAGYSQHGFATADMNVDAGVYPYYST